MLASLGTFVFDMGTLPYSEQQRRSDWRHARSPRVGARDASQFVGPGEDRVTISGSIVPELAGSYGAIEDLRAMADAGDAYDLVDGTGRVWGRFVIAALDTRRRHLLDNGVGRVADFAIDLDRVA